MRRIVTTINLRILFINLGLVIGAIISLAACAPTAPIQEFASENAIALRYSAYDSVPTLTAEAIEMAVQHCSKKNKYANYKGGNAVNAFSPEEIHHFACERTKTDDSAVIAAQSQRPTYVTAPVHQTYQVPRQTSCSTIGTFTNCYSY